MGKTIGKQQTRTQKGAKAHSTGKLGRAGQLSPSRSASAQRPAGHGSVSPLQKQVRGKQKFHASHFREEDFRPDGLRPYARYRDLGMSAATSGLLQAHVIRFVPPCDPALVSKRHYHEVQLQMIYVLKGWIKGEYEGEVVTLQEGAAWLQPPRFEHRVLDYSDDCEVLEFVVPADFKTIELD